MNSLSNLPSLVICNTAPCWIIRNRISPVWRLNCHFDSSASCTGSITGRSLATSHQPCVLIGDGRNDRTAPIYALWLMCAIAKFRSCQNGWQTPNYFAEFRALNIDVTYKSKFLADASHAALSGLVVGKAQCHYVAYDICKTDERLKKQNLAWKLFNDKSRKGGER